MPLLDHFRPPVFPTWPWESLHTMWISVLAEHLNLNVLPKGYLALTTVSFGGRIEVDVATVQANGPVHSRTAEAQPAEPPWGPPVATLALPAVMPDTAEVRILDSETGNRLVAAIELVSPGNKDRTGARQAFVAKCAGYLYSGVGLIVVDVVTIRSANLHNELVALLEPTRPFEFPAGTASYAVAYHPVRSEDGSPPGAAVELWARVLNVGQPLPTLPLSLRGGPTVGVDLETTYMAARHRQRL